MYALVYHGPDSKAWEEMPKPVVIDDTDAIVRVDATTICGSDLHILKGDVPEVTDGGGGWILRSSHRRHPSRVRAGPLRRHLHLSCPRRRVRRRILRLADILPTGYEIGVLTGHVQPGDVVAIVGAGPIGLPAIIGARLFSPSHIIAIDLADSRLDAAKRFGADVVVNNNREDALAALMDLIGGLGADVAIEAVGIPATFELATTLIRPCGHVANIGVHGKPATLHLDEPLDP